MTYSKIKIKSEIIKWQIKIFKSSFRRKKKLNKIQYHLGKTNGLKILEVSAGDAALSHILKKDSLDWKTIAINDSAAKSLNYFFKEKIDFVRENHLPYSDGEFDLLILVDSLKNIIDDYEFLQECHRVINNEGWVLISERRTRPISFITLFQHLLKTAPDNLGCARNGYTPDQLYRVLKDGFDVPEISCYSNTLLEINAVFGDAFQRSLFHLPTWIKSRENTKEDLYKYQTLYNFARLTFPIIWISSLFNILPKHEMIIKSRRRRWSPRRQPKLIDGRSIAEAAINTRIGTAAPF